MIQLTLFMEMVIFTFINKKLIHYLTIYLELLIPYSIRKTDDVVAKIKVLGAAYGEPDPDTSKTKLSCFYCKKQVWIYLYCPSVESGIRLMKNCNLSSTTAEDIL